MIVLILFFIYFIYGHAFQPVIITSTSAYISRVDNETSDQMQAICGVSIPKIIGNRTVRTYPWAVSVTEGGKNKLGGVIISPFHILTAAHPFIKFARRRGIGFAFDSAPCWTSGYRTFDEIRDRTVTYGGRCIRGHVKGLPNHPLCEYSDMIQNKIRSVLVDGEFLWHHCMSGHDWAIIEVEDEIIFSNNVRPICLPYPGQYFQNYLTIFGWGRTNTFYESSPYLREIPMVLDRNCDPPWSDKMPNLVEDYVCTKAMNTTDYNSPRTCYGDSGSGMQQTDPYGISTLIGITSYGSQGCPPNELARFTRVDAYLDSICEFTGVCYTVQEYE